MKTFLFELKSEIFIGGPPLPQGNTVHERKYFVASGENIKEAFLKVVEKHSHWFETDSSTGHYYKPESISFICEVVNCD